MKVTRSFAAAAALIVAASVAQAQAHSHANHGAQPGQQGAHAGHASQQDAARVPSMLAGLDLTAEQAERISKIHAEHHAEMMALEDSSAEVRSAAKERGHAAMRAVLTPAQQEQFDEKMRHHGSGGEGHGSHGARQQSSEPANGAHDHASEGGAKKCCDHGEGGEKKKCCDHEKGSEEKKGCCSK